MSGLTIEGVDLIELSSSPIPLAPVNTYLIYGEKLTLVDTGTNTSENWNLLTKALEERELTIYDIDQVLLTHHHIDHVGLLDRILEVHPIPVIGHSNNRLWLKQGSDFKEYYSGFFEKFYSEYGVPEELWVNIIKDFLDMMDCLSCHCDLNIELNNDGDPIPGLSEWKVIVTKGHTQSHISFYRERDQVLIAGDHIIKNSPTNAQIEPTFKQDTERAKPLIQYMANLKKCVEIPVDIVLPGHGSVVQNVPHLVNDRLNRIESRASNLKKIIRETYKSGFELISELYNSKTIEKSLMLVVWDTVGHLDFLLEKGEITEKHINGIRYFRKK